MNIRPGASTRVVLSMFFLQLLTACGHMPGTSFSAPAWREEDKIRSPMTVAAAVLLAENRQALYVKETGDLKNAPQPLDMGLLASGLVAVGSVIYGGHGDLAKGAALSGTGLFGIRNYYSFESRSAVYTAGADALGCIARVGRTVIAVDGERPKWTELQTEALNFQSDQALAIRRLAPTALGAAERIRGETRNIDAEVNKKIESPTTPDISGLFNSYKERLALVDKEKEQNEDAEKKGAALLASTAANPSFQLQLLKPEEQFNIKAAALLSNATLVKALTELNHELEQCRLKVI